MKKKGISIALILCIFMNIVVPIFSYAENENNNLITENEFYYSSLSQAIEDANNNTTANADSNLEEGVASVVINNDKVIVTLLKDYEENNELQISNNIDLNLNGKKLNLNGNNSEQGYGFVINKYKTLSIFGQIEGSEIFHDVSLERQFIMFQVIGDININGGKYTNNVADNSASFINVSDVSIHNINVQNIQLNMYGKNKVFGIKTSVRINNSTVVFKDNKCEIYNRSSDLIFIYGKSNLLFNNNDVKVNSVSGIVSGIGNVNNAIINNNKLEIYSENGRTVGLSGFTNGIIEDLDLKVMNEANNYNYGIICSGGSKAIIKNSNIVCDNKSNISYGNNDVVGIDSSGAELYLNNVNIESTDIGIEVRSNTKLYVNGGSIKSYGRAALHLLNGKGENYIENAHLISADKSTYNGEFNTDGWNDNSVCMSIGRLGVYSNNVSTYLDNCIIEDQDSLYGYFELKDEFEKLYISNSEFRCANTPKFLIEDVTDHVFFGNGNTMPETEIKMTLQGEATKDNNVHQNTGEVYKRSNISYLKLGGTNYKDIYVEGDKFDKSNLEIILINADGTESTITDYIIIDEQNELIRNQEYITVKYNELELQVPIKVYANSNYDITIRKDIYCELDDLVRNINYIDVQGDKVRCLVNKKAFDNFRQSDIVKPFVEITASTSIDNTEELSKTKADSITYTFTWSEKVYGFKEDSITVENGTKGEFKEVTPNQVYTLVVDNDVEEEEITQNVKVNEDVCTDLVLNGNEETIKSITIDKAAPTCEITANTDRFEEEGIIIYTLSWSEEVLGFTEDDITIENGTIENMEQGDNNTYTITVKVEEVGEHKLYILENKCNDEIGNSNKASNIYTIENGLGLEIMNYREVEENEIRYLEKIMPNTTIETIKQNIESNGTIKIYNKKGEEIIDEEELIATGMEIVIKFGNEERRYKVVVKGDVTGDGKFNIADLTKLSRHIAEVDIMTKREYLKASDVYEKDGQCGILTDLVKMSRVLAEIDTL